jgi:hypothetical protein
MMMRLPAGGPAARPVIFRYFTSLLTQYLFSPGSCIAILLVKTISESDWIRTNYMRFGEFLEGSFLLTRVGYLICKGRRVI